MVSLSKSLSREIWRQMPRLKETRKKSGLLKIICRCAPMSETVETWDLQKDSSSIVKVIKESSIT